MKPYEMGCVEDNVSTKLYRCIENDNIDTIERIFGIGI